MNEAEWLVCADPQPMLEFLRGKASDRKFRLFAFACEMRLWHNDESEVAHLTEAHEQFIEGKIAWKALKRVLLSRRRVLGRYHSHTMARYALAAVTADDAHEAAERMAGFASGYVYFLAIEQKQKHGEHPADGDEVLVSVAEFEQNAEREKQAFLLRDLFGNPFRRITLNTAWLTATVVQLAQAIYDDRTFDQMPALAHELVKSGCDNEEIQAHLRGPGPHVRGCWVVDAVLGKE